MRQRRTAPPTDSPPGLPPAIGIVGLGNMGMPMAANLLRGANAAGATLLVHHRRREAVDALLEAGAVFAETPAELADADVVVSVLPDLPQLEHVLGIGGGPHEAGLLAAIETPTTIVVCSTSDPERVRALRTELRERRGDLVDVVDAPVSGGTDGAEAGTLAVMVGGDEASVARVLPVLALVGAPVHLGPLGAGEVAKACNQIVVSATIMALGEAVVLAASAGIDVDAMLGLFAEGYAASRVLETRRRRLVDRDYTVSGPARFMVKDLTAAIAEAERGGVSLPQTNHLLAAFSDLTARGFGDDDISVARAYVESLGNGRPQ